MGAIGVKILEILRRLYGKDFVSKTIGTRANVVKPKELDTNAPTKNIYSKDAFKDAELQGLADEKIQEYAPFIFSNRNQKELMNYLENAEQLLKQKKKDFGVTDQLESVKKQKPEADVLNIKTGKKAEGIETLKEELGLPPEVSPKSKMGQILQETKRLGKEKEILEKDTMGAIDEAMESFFARTATKDVAAEGKRRAVMRNILLKDKKLNLPAEIRESLKNYDDLKRGGDESMDPLAIFNKYYKRDNKKLGQLDDIIDTTENEFKAADEFLKDTEFELKEKSFDEKLKDLPDDIPDMAEGGRIGYSSGTSASIVEIISLVETLPFDQRLQFLEMLPPSVRAEVEERLNMAKGGRIGFKNAGLSYLMGL
tara:strand:+ start:225 stop:1331 length:1107 start_codon:yes stop_codon:yes gene_type:complete